VSRVASLVAVTTALPQFKLKPFKNLGWVRQRFILTSQEKRVIVFAIVMLGLGLAAKSYRQGHPHPRPSLPVPLQEATKVQNSTRHESKP